MGNKGNVHVKKIPMRQCTGCNERKEKKSLIRIIRTPEDEIAVDFTGKKNGRGAYICPNADCFAKAVASKGLERSFKMPIEKSVYDKLAKELENIEAG